MQGANDPYGVSSALDGAKTNYDFITSTNDFYCNYWRSAPQSKCICGKYEIMTPQGKKGLPPGQDKVTVSVRRNPDGTPADPNTPPMDSKAVEVLPAKFSDRERTELTATVGSEAKPHDFSVQSAKKR
jgi:hypothetical protein